ERRVVGSAERVGLVTITLARVGVGRRVGDAVAWVGCRAGTGEPCRPLVRQLVDLVGELEVLKLQRELTVACIVPVLVCGVDVGLPTGRAAVAAWRDSIAAEDDARLRVAPLGAPRLDEPPRVEPCLL